jgi:hypothetical protein
MHRTGIILPRRDRAALSFLKTPYARKPHYPVVGHGTNRLVLF